MIMDTGTMTMPVISGRRVMLGDVLEDNYGRGKVVAYGRGEDGYEIFALVRDSGAINLRHVEAMGWPDSWDEIRRSFSDIRVKGLTIDNGEAMCNVDESDVTRLFERAKSLAMKEAR